MKKVLFVSLLLAANASLFAQTFSTFKEITDHLDTGGEISVVVHDKDCKIDDPNSHKIPVSTMVLKPNGIIFTDKALGFDAVKYTPTNYFPFFANGMLQRGSFVLLETGQIFINIAFFDAETNKKHPEARDVKIICQLGDGVSVYRKE